VFERIIYLNERIGKRYNQKKGKIMCKLVAYLRVSTGKQASSGLGLEAQQTAIDNYIARTGHELIDTFVEIESGKNNDRAELHKAIDRCDMSGSRLLIAKLDRLSRSVRFISELQESRIKFTACDMPDATEMTVQIMAAVAQQERKAISERTKVALAELKKNGVKLGNPKLDQARAKIDVIAANKKSAAVRGKEADKFAFQVKKVIDKSGLTGLREISRHLMELNILTRRGSEKWTPAGVKRVMERACTVS